MLTEEVYFVYSFGFSFSFLFLFGFCWGEGEELEVEDWGLVGPSECVHVSWAKISD